MNKERDIEQQNDKNPWKNFKTEKYIAGSFYHNIWDEILNSF